VYKPKCLNDCNHDCSSDSTCEVERMETRIKVPVACKVKRPRCIPCN
jgi:hypothetical protein